MTEEEIEDCRYIKSKMENEGFDYCFRHYSNFKEIKDDEFHELRRQYIESSELLEDYINNKCDGKI